MKIIHAAHLGMCFGVRDAIAFAREQNRQQPVTILGELVHNEIVMDELRAQGIRVASEAADVQTVAAMITAHGASQKAIDRARARGLQVTEATCPLVAFAHRALASLVAEGFYPVVIGKPGHVEVRGLTEDLAEVSIVLAEEDIERLPARSKFGVIAQTTQPLDRVQRLLDRIQARFPAAEVRYRDTVCQPTKQRQAAAIDLARRCDAVVVIGGAGSNNTRELAETCRRYGAAVHHVQSAAELEPEWFAECEHVGLTAGTSTPDHVIAAVDQRLREIALNQQTAELPAPA